MGCTCLILNLEDAASALRWRIACTYAEDFTWTAASQIRSTPATAASRVSHCLMRGANAGEQAHQLCNRCEHTYCTVGLWAAHRTRRACDRILTWVRSCIRLAA